MAVMGSVMTNKYAEGYPGKRYYGGCEYVDMAENICIERAKKLFGAQYANVQPHSGSQANYAVYAALLKPGDTVLGMALDQGGPLMHIIAAKAVAFGETLKPGFKEYQHQIILNAAALAKTLTASGFELISGGTDNHLILMDLRKLDISGKELESRLDSVHITANKNSVPGDPRGPQQTSGLRLGSPAVTARGFREAEMEETGMLIAKAVYDFPAAKDEILERTAALCERFPIYKEI